MKLLVLGDNHNDIENMLFYIEKMSSIDFDVIIYSGDFSDVNVPKGFTQEDVVKIIIKELKTLKKPIMAIPGNNDVKNIINVLEKEGVSVHGVGKVVDDVGFYGFGGAKTPFKTLYEPSDEEMETGIRKALEYVKNSRIKVQITHNPPINTKLDLIFTGLHVGSPVVRKFIEEIRPVAAISAHIHEARGIDYINNTLLMNPGRISEGYVGFINIKENHAEGHIINLID